MDTSEDIPWIIDQCTGVGTLLDELTLLRTALKLYAEGMPRADAMARASQLLSNALTKTVTP